MKKHSIGVCAVVGVIVTLAIVACTITQKHGPGVYIHETYVEIYPGTKISSHDQKALDAVLKKFSKSFYQMRAYDRGKLVKTRGSLADARIDQTLVADAIKASQKGVSDFTLQLGIGIGNPNFPALLIHPMWTPPSTPIPSQAGQSSGNEYQVSKRLVSLVTPILQKYSYDQGANVVKSGGR